MPKDVQEAVFSPDFDMEMDLPGYNPVLPVPTEKLEELIPLIEGASRPVIYAGGGASSPRKPPRTCWNLRNAPRFPWRPP